MIQWNVSKQNPQWPSCEIPFPCFNKIRWKQWKVLQQVICHMGCTHVVPLSSVKRSIWCMCNQYAAERTVSSIPSLEYRCSAKKKYTYPGRAWEHQDFHSKCTGNTSHWDSPSQVAGVSDCRCCRAQSASVGAPHSKHWSHSRVLHSNSVHHEEVSWPVTHLNSAH